MQNYNAKLSSKFFILKLRAFQENCGMSGLYILTLLYHPWTPPPPPNANHDVRRNNILIGGLRSGRGIAFTGTFKSFSYSVRIILNL